MDIAGTWGALPSMGIQLVTGIYWINANPLLSEFAKEKLLKWFCCREEMVEIDEFNPAGIYIG